MMQRSAMAGRAAFVTLLLLADICACGCPYYSAVREEQDDTAYNKDSVSSYDRRNKKPREEPIDFEVLRKDYAFYDEVDPKVLAFPDAKRNPNFKLELSEPVSKGKDDEVSEQYRRLNGDALSRPVAPPAVQEDKTTPPHAPVQDGGVSVVECTSEWCKKILRRFTEDSCVLACVQNKMKNKDGEAKKHGKACRMQCGIQPSGAEEIKRADDVGELTPGNGYVKEFSMPPPCLKGCDMSEMNESLGLQEANKKPCGCLSCTKEIDSTAYLEKQDRLNTSGTEDTSASSSTFSSGPEKITGESGASFETLEKDYDFYNRIKPSDLQCGEAIKNPNFQHEPSVPIYRTQLDDVINPDSDTDCVDWTTQTCYGASINKMKEDPQATIGRAEERIPSGESGADQCRCQMAGECRRQQTFGTENKECSEEFIVKCCPADEEQKMADSSKPKKKLNFTERIQAYETAEVEYKQHVSQVNDTFTPLKLPKRELNERRKSSYPFLPSEHYNEDHKDRKKENNPSLY